MSHPYLDLIDGQLARGDDITPAQAIIVLATVLDDRLAAIAQRMPWEADPLLAATLDLLNAGRKFVGYHDQIPAVPVNPDPGVGPAAGGCVCGDCARFKAAIARAEGRVP